jgi:hypothetical protein
MAISEDSRKLRRTVYRMVITVGLAEVVCKVRKSSIQAMPF